MVPTGRNYRTLDGTVQRLELCSGLLGVNLEALRYWEPPAGD